MSTSLPPSELPTSPPPSELPTPPPPFRTVDDKRKQLEMREATIKVLDGQVRAVNQRKEDEAAARRQEIQGAEGEGGKGEGGEREGAGGRGEREF